jgi:hypothetical protein
LANYADSTAFVATEGTAAEGDIFANTTSDKINWYNGAAWKVVHDYKDDFAMAGAPTANEDSGDGFEIGSLGYVPSTGKLYWLADATLTSAVWKELLLTAAAQVVTNKDIDGGTASDTSRITLGKNTTTNLNSLTKKEAVMVYDTTTKKVKVGDGSTWLTVGSAGGGSAISWKLNYSPAPGEENSSGLEVLDFNYTDSQGVYCLLTVPSDYVAGTQILLKNGAFATTATTNKVKFKTTTYLIESGTTVLGTYSNSHASTNAEVTVDGDASTVTDIGDVDCTDATGQINGQSVSGGDKILILLIRDCAGESASAAADARLLRDSFTPFFG